MNLRSLLPLLLASALLPAAARAATLNVPAQYPTIQTGVNAAANGDTVLVADGTYTGNGNRDIDFGGKNITVASQHGATSTIIDCGGTASSDGSGNHRGFYIHSGETTAVVSGFTVKNGYTAYASGRADSSFGGGICIHGSGASVQDCVFTNNIAELGGGVCFYNDGAIGNQINLTRCTITANAASFALGGEGGGVYNANLAGTITVADCSITNNTAEDGAGVFNSSPNGSSVAVITLTGCTISGNVATPTTGGNGGGVYNYIFNYYSVNSAIKLTNCTVVANSAQTGGGISNNNQNGGADDTSGGTIQLTNCTIAENNGSGVYSGTSGVGSPMMLTNTIVFGNAGGGVLNGSNSTSSTSSPAATYSDIQGGYPGTGNIDADPQFVNAAGGDFHLQPGSPCLGAGTNIGAPATDKDGRARPIRPSIGAYELGAVLAVPSQYPTIQAGVDAAAEGGIVFVADGTYTGGGNRDIDFHGKNIAVISSHGATSTIIDCGGTASSDGSGNHRGFYIHSGETAAVISGFTVKNGYQSLADGVGNSGGGAIRIDKSSVTIRACTLLNNTAYDGGAVANYNYQSSGPSVVSLIGCAIIGNTGHDGGGVCNRNYNYTAYPGLLSLTECTVSGNTAQQGGGVLSQNGSNSKTTLINCVVSGNTAATAGGGIQTSNSDYYGDGNGGTTLLSACTLVNNSAPNGGGINNYSISTSLSTLTNCIFYANGGGQIYNSNPNSSDAVVTYSDVQGGYPGMGNLDFDPKFVGADKGNFHLKPGSPCLGAGTSAGAPATDKDGRTRPNPPSIGAYELVPPSVSHLLWGNVSGEAALWTVFPNGTFHDDAHYGPFAGWSAKALADTSAGPVRLLWTNTSGEAALWTVQPDGSFHDDIHFGPYPGWSARALSAGPDGRLHLLWNHSPDNKMALWAISPDGSFHNAQYGPYPNWQAKGVATGGDNVTDVIWTNTNGTLAAWKTNNSDDSIVSHQYGPYAGGWTANAVAAGADGLGLIAWSSASGTQTLWNEDFGSGSFTQYSYGPYSGWGIKSVAIGADGLSRLLWSHSPDSEAALWVLASSANFSSQHFGPYPGWSVTALSAGQ